MFFKLAVAALFIILALYMVANRLTTYSVAVVDTESTTSCTHSRYFNKLCTKLQSANKNEVLFITEPYYQVKWNTYELSREFKPSEVKIN